MSTRKIVHVNDVAGVAVAAVTQARRDGLDWELWPLPAVRGRRLPAKAWVRLRDVWRFRRAGRAAAIIHVHYGHFAYYAWVVRRPYVLHLHGTDVNANLARRGLGGLTRRAIRKASAVAYSTPDLAVAVQRLRPDAVWLPAPLHPDLVDESAAHPPPAGADRPRRVVFASRWDPVKGLDRLLEVARGIASTYPDAEMIGIDWGVGAAAAAAIGVRLEPLLPEHRFRALLESADVVIGQLASGALGVADLTALALGRPLIARFECAAAYDDAPELWNTVDTDPVRAVGDILAALQAPAASSLRVELLRRSAQARAWALRDHGAEQFVRSAERMYDTIACGATER